MCLNFEPSNICCYGIVSVPPSEKIWTGFLFLTSLFLYNDIHSFPTIKNLPSYFQFILILVFIWSQLYHHSIRFASFVSVESCQDSIVALSAFMSSYLHDLLLKRCLSLAATISLSLCLLQLCAIRVLLLILAAFDVTFRSDFEQICAVP